MSRWDVTGPEFTTGRMPTRESALEKKLRSRFSKTSQVPTPRNSEDFLSGDSTAARFTSRPLARSQKHDRQDVRFIDAAITALHFDARDDAWAVLHRTGERCSGR